MTNYTAGLAARTYTSKEHQFSYLSTSLDLQSQVVHTDISNLCQQLLRLLGVSVNPRLNLRKQLSATTLNHVAEQSPRSTTEADQRHLSLEPLARQRDGLVHIIELGGDIDVLGEDLAVLLVVGGLERAREVRALLVNHLDHHAHGLRNHEDVGEDDGRVDEAGVALDRLQCNRRGNLGVATALEEVPVALGLVILGEVTAGCPIESVHVQFNGRSVSPSLTLSHHPHGRALNGLA